MKVTLKKIIMWFAESFKNKEGKTDGRAITIALSVLYCIQSGIADQYFTKTPSEFIFNSFWIIVVAGLAILSPELISKFKGVFKGDNSTNNSSSTNNPDKDNNRVL
jgi:hypothetical protein